MWFRVNLSFPIFVTAFMKTLIIISAFCFLGINYCYPQSADTAKAHKAAMQPFFIINAGTTISAYYHDKPLSIETAADFDDYVQHNAKTLKDAQVIVTGKPKTGTFDEVLKTLSHYRIKNVKKNILTN